MIVIRFGGWFQCRLATDPDPFDEPRGVSGYVRAYVDEPDLDRIIRFHAPPCMRSLGPKVGVYCTAVIVDGRGVPAHPLLGAKVDLLDNPAFEGRNKVIADDGLEPVYPFRLAITQNSFHLERAVVPSNPDYAFDELLAGGVDTSAPEIIEAATGISDLQSVWIDRLGKLTVEQQHTQDELAAAALAERIEFLRRNTNSAGGGVAGFFGARMNYLYELKSDPVIVNADGVLPREISPGRPWRASFWLGAWDADVLCGYCLGALEIPLRNQTTVEVVSHRRIV